MGLLGAGHHGLLLVYVLFAIVIKVLIIHVG